MDEIKCHCVIWHAHTQAERDEVGRRLDYARSVGDLMMFPILIEHLNSGGCPAYRASVTA